jgi:hypothetical protein
MMIYDSHKRHFISSVNSTCAYTWSKNKLNCPQSEAISYLSFSRKGAVSTDVPEYVLDWTGLSIDVAHKVFTDLIHN